MTCLLDIGAQSTTINIVDGGTLRLSYSSDVSGNDFTHALVKTMNLDPKKAEFLKREQGLMSQEMKDALLPLINLIIIEVERIFKDFEIPGGNALKHYASINISLFPLTSDKNRIKIKLENDKERSIGNPIRFSIPKNKVGIPHRSAKIPIIWGVGI